MALNEIAVLYRAHYHAMELQMELTRRRIPYVITTADCGSSSKRM